MSQVDDRDLDRTAAIIRSMTPTERVNPKIINGSRRLRIANGSGVKVNDVNQLVDRFFEARKMMGQLGGGWAFPARGARPARTPRARRGRRAATPRAVGRPRRRCRRDSPAASAGSAASGRSGRIWRVAVRARRPCAGTWRAATRHPASRPVQAQAAQGVAPRVLAILCRLAACGRRVCTRFTSRCREVRGAIGRPRPAARCGLPRSESGGPEPPTVRVRSVAAGRPTSGWPSGAMRRPPQPPQGGRRCAASLRPGSDAGRRVHVAGAVAVVAAGGGDDTDERSRSRSTPANRPRYPRSPTSEHADAESGNADRVPRRAPPSSSAAAAPPRRATRTPDGVSRMSLRHGPARRAGVPHHRRAPRAAPSEHRRGRAAPAPGSQLGGGSLHMPGRPPVLAPSREARRSLRR